MSKRPDVDRVEITFCEEGDTSGPNDYNEITFRIEKVAGNSGMENYFVIETKRWAFDTEKELMDLLERFQSAVLAAEIGEAK